MLIPRVIYQTTSDVSILRNEYIKNREEIAKINPKWQMKIFSDKDVVDFIGDEFGKSFLDYYLRINPKYGAARADFFRYLIIYKNGGLYLDIKSTSTKNLDNVINDSDSFITSTWPTSINGIDTSIWGKHGELDHAEYQNWFLLSAPGSKILEEVIESVCINIDQYSPFREGVGRLAVLKTTGPIAYSRVVHKYVLDGEVRLATNEELGLKYTIYGSDLLKHTTVDQGSYRNLLTPIVRTSQIKSTIVQSYYSGVLIVQALIKKMRKIL